MSKPPIRVLLVDDSAVVRGLLARALETDPEIRVAGTAMHGEAALAWMRKSETDVVVLDVEMPVLDGLETLLRIQQEFRKVPVIMASSLTVAGAETTIRALKLGAAGCIAKPQSTSLNESIQQLVKELVPLVKVLGRSPVRRVAQRVEIPRPIAQWSRVAPRILVIGASTGGPQALTTVLTGLRAEFPLPICIVQHMPAAFTGILAGSLQKDAKRPCRQATHGETLVGGTTYVAPGGYHMRLDRSGDRVRLLLDQGPEEHFCRPSVNPLFHSAADCFGAAVLAVMLTGMGEDGIEGSQSIVRQKGFLIAQDERSSVVWGMPGAVVRASLAGKVLPLSDIAFEITRLCALQAVHA